MKFYRNCYTPFGHFSVPQLTLPLMSNFLPFRDICSLVSLSLIGWLMLDKYESMHEIKNESIYMQIITLLLCSFEMVENLEF